MAPKKVVDEECYHAVKQLFKDNNRPFNTQTVIDHTKSKYTLTVVKRALGRLVDEGLILTTGGKVYWPDQSRIPVLNEKDLLAMKNENEALDAEIKELSAKIASLNDKLSVITATPQSSQIPATLNKLDADIAAQNEMLEIYRSKGEPVDDATKKKAEMNYKVYLKTWKERREACLNILDNLEENSNLGKKELYEAIGVETEEDVGAVSLKDYSKLHSAWSKRK